MISSLAIQPGNREVPQLQLAQLGWGDFALGSKPWQISLVRPTWAPQCRDTFIRRHFCSKPHALPVWVVL